MASPPASRAVGDLSFPEVSRHLKATSILCLPLGAIEQHGPHLPLNTDVIVAEGLTGRLIDTLGAEFDLWRLPVLALGLSREHDWAPGTMSLSIAGFAGLLREFARAITRALPARNLAIVNGHGGNRGLLENLLHELRGDFGLNGCVMHPFDLAKVASSPAAPDIHGGKAETSLMLALAPALVRRELIEPARQPSDPDSLRAQIFDRGTTWPWRTDDPRLAHAGIIGDAQAATAEHGQALIDRIVAEARGVFARLRDNQKRL